MTDRDEIKTHVDGKVSFKGKNLLTYNLRPDYFDLNGRDGYAWINEPTNQDIAEALDGMTLFTCKSYSGSASSLCLTVKYYTVENVFGDSYNGGYSLGKGSCNASALGTFIPLYDADEGCYRFVFFSYERTTEINARDLYDHAYWAGAENLYIKKAVTFGTKEEVTFTWSGDGESYALIGKGMVASKGKLNVLISNGAFTLSSGCGFKNASYTLSDAKVFSMGALNAANLKFTDSSWDVSGGKMVAKGAVSLEDSSIVTDSAVTVAALDMKDGSSIELESSKAQSVSLNGKNSDNRLDASYLDVAGKMSVAGNLELAGAASICLYDPSGKNKAMPLAVKGTLTLGSGSTLTLSGALSARDMVLDGGSINLTSNKPLTIKVGNRLDINAPVALNLGFTVADKDVNKKSFKILTFKSSNLGG